MFNYSKVTKNVQGQGHTDRYKMCKTDASRMKEGILVKYSITVRSIVDGGTEQL